MMNLAQNCVVVLLLALGAYGLWCFGSRYQIEGDDRAVDANAGGEYAQAELRDN